MTNAVLLPEETVSRVPPANLVPGDERLFEREYRKTFAPVRSFSAGSCAVDRFGFLYCGGSLLPARESFAVASIRAPKIVAKSLYSRLACRKTVDAGDALFVTDEFSNGYFHWLGDVLPKLEVLAANVGSEELKRRTLIIPAMADFPYAVPSLEAFDLGRVLVLSKDERARCSSAFGCGPLAPTGNYRPSVMKSLRDRFRSRFSSDPSDGPRIGRRLFISRAEAPKRRIANETELLPVLEKHGFERIVLEKLAFADQVKAVAGASALAGNHGAGLTNMLFLAPGSDVVELRLEDDAENNCFYSLASALDLRYSYLKCRSARNGEDTHTADFVVDPERLDSTLASIEKGL